ncbi:MAG: hypothetical protein M5R36_11005 [Deltaproteobacteria bacterium]|nr:hypothetical protein [Deltaproteobacteria bacterium]
MLAAIAVPAFSDSMRGKLYLVTKQTTVSDPAGTPCLPTGYGEDVEAFATVITVARKGRWRRVW